jgi:hypothetical protein
MLFELWIAPFCMKFKALFDDAFKKIKIDVPFTKKKKNCDGSHIV